MMPKDSVIMLPLYNCNRIIVITINIVCLLTSGFTSLSTFFQSYGDDVWMWQEA